MSVNVYHVYVNVLLEIHNKNSSCIDYISKIRKVILFHNYEMANFVQKIGNGP